MHELVSNSLEKLLLPAWYMNAHQITVLLDTNIFIAAYWSKRSASARIVNACIDGAITAHFTSETYEETTRMLQKIGASGSFMKTMDMYWRNAVQVEPVVVEQPECQDPEDRKFLEAAVGGETDFLVTNDQHLLCIQHVGRTEILKPSSVLRMLSG